MRPPSASIRRPEYESWPPNVANLRHTVDLRRPWVPSPEMRGPFPLPPVSSSSSRSGVSEEPRRRRPARDDAVRPRSRRSSGLSVEEKRRSQTGSYRGWQSRARDGDEEDEDEPAARPASARPRGRERERERERQQERPKSWISSLSLNPKKLFRTCLLLSPARGVEIVDVVD